MTNVGRGRSHSIADVEVEVLPAVEGSPGSSAWRTGLRVLYDQLLYQFHVQHVRVKQVPLDYERRKSFCD
jgi:hypothetical protein